MRACSRNKASSIENRYMEVEMENIDLTREAVEDVFECACDIQDKAAQDAVVTLSGETLSIEPEGGKTLLLKARQVSALDIGDVDIKMTMQAASLRLYRFGRRFDRAAELIGSWYKKGKLADSVVLEKSLETFDEIQYELSRKGKRPANLRMYATHAAITDSRNGKVKRMPYSYIRDILDEGLSVNIRMQKGPDIAVSMLGRRKDVFLRRLKELMEVLACEVGRKTVEILGIEDAGQDKLISGILPDGRAVLLGAIEEKSPMLAEAILRKASTTRTAPIIDKADELAFGFKKGLMGELDGDYIWMVARLGGAAVMETVSGSEDASRAAYMFDMQGLPFPAFVDDLSWSLTLVGFRREPIYLSDEALKEPGRERYLQAIEDVPELVRLRTLYRGRVAHTEGGGWVSKVLEAAGKPPQGGR